METRKNEETLNKWGCVETVAKAVAVEQSELGENGENQQTLVELSLEDLTLIGKQSRKELTAEEVYTFSVRLCDNLPDRDMERFTRKTLEELSALFVGVSGIFDHNWTATGQSCRIYKCEVVEESSSIPETAGEGDCFLKASVYMLKTTSNADLIAEIEAGIKREVSVGCAVEKNLCSICGSEYQSCSHQKGEYYGEKRCFVSLETAKDAYEFSFVAVPAQPKSGVLKGLDSEKTLSHLLDLLEKQGETVGEKQEFVDFELEKLLEEARIGREYLDIRRKEMVRCGLLAEESAQAHVLRKMAEKMSLAELDVMVGIFQKKTPGKIPLKSQLPYQSGLKSTSFQEDKAFLI